MPLFDTSTTCPGRNRPARRCSAGRPDALHAARAAAAGDVRQHGWALNYASNSFWRSGDPARAIELAREAVAPLRQAGDRDGHSQALAGLVFTLRGAW